MSEQEKLAAWEILNILSAMKQEGLTLADAIERFREGPRWTREEVRAVKDSVVLSEVMGCLTVCPWCDGKFNVLDRWGIYYCFDCRETGDIFAWVQKRDGCSFVEAYEMVKAGRAKEQVEAALSKPPPGGG